MVREDRMDDLFQACADAFEDDPEKALRRVRAMSPDPIESAFALARWASRLENAECFDDTGAALRLGILLAKKAREGGPKAEEAYDDASEEECSRILAPDTAAEALWSAGEKAPEILEALAVGGEERALRSGRGAGPKLRSLCYKEATERCADHPDWRKRVGPWLDAWEADATPTQFEKWMGSPRFIRGWLRREGSLPEKLERFGVSEKAQELAAKIVASDFPKERESGSEWGAWLARRGAEPASEWAPQIRAGWEQEAIMAEAAPSRQKRSGPL